MKIETGLKKAFSVNIFTKLFLLGGFAFASFGFLVHVPSVLAATGGDLYTVLSSSQTGTAIIYRLEARLSPQASGNYTSVSITTPTVPSGVSALNWSCTASAGSTFGADSLDDGTSTGNTLAAGGSIVCLASETVTGQDTYLVAAVTAGPGDTDTDLTDNQSSDGLSVVSVTGSSAAPTISGKTKPYMCVALYDGLLSTTPLDSGNAPSYSTYYGSNVTSTFGVNRSRISACADSSGDWSYAVPISNPLTCGAHNLRVEELRQDVIASYTDKGAGAGLFDVYNIDYITGLPANARTFAAGVATFGASDVIEYAQEGSYFGAERIFTATGTTIAGSVSGTPSRIHSLSATDVSDITSTNLSAVAPKDVKSLAVDETNDRYAVVIRQAYWTPASGDNIEVRKLSDNSLVGNIAGYFMDARIANGKIYALGTGLTGPFTLSTYDVLTLAPVGTPVDISSSPRDTSNGVPVGARVSPDKTKIVVLMQGVLNSLNVQVYNASNLAFIAEMSFGSYVSATDSIMSTTNDYTVALGYPLSQAAAIVGGDVEFTNDGLYMFVSSGQDKSASTTGLISVYDMTSYTRLAQVTSIEDITEIEVSPDGKKLYGAQHLYGAVAALEVFDIDYGDPNIISSAATAPILTATNWSSHGLDSTLITASTISLSHTTTCQVSVGDYVFKDVNNNGVFDGSDTAVPGVKVNLIPVSADTNTDGLLSTAELTAYLASNTPTTTTTNGSGQYLFDNLADGSSWFIHIDKSNFINASDPLNSSPALYDYLPSDGVPAQGDTMVNNANHGSIPSGSYVAHAVGVVSSKIVLNGGSETGDGESNANHDAAVDFGFYLGASLGNQVWVDANNNGTYDASEQVLSGITITLLDSSGNAIAGAPTMTTNAQGQYHYGGLVAGNYRIKFSNIPSKYHFTTKDQVASTDNTSDPDTSTGITGVLGLSTGQFLPLLDAGLVETTSLVDTGLRIIGSLALAVSFIGVAVATVPRIQRRKYQLK